jgi:thiopeptide-type bacteriocin biosynthesis protein
MATTPPWLSLHIAYHRGPMDRLLVEHVLPSVKSFLRAGSVESFFFVRYSFGGPHLRLRLLPSPGREEEIRSTIARDAAEFLHRHPSPVGLPEAEILSRNRVLRQHDNCDEPEDRILADNTLQEIPFEPETERYGGESLLPSSLEFFALSSVRALHLLAGRNGVPDGRWLAIAMRLLVRYAFGFAGNTEELQEILAFPQSAERRAPDAIRERGDRVFAKSKEDFSALVRQEIRRLEATLPALDDTASACRLGDKLRQAALAVRKRIAVSQIHMTANRLGLRNVDEVYVARLLIRTLEAIEAEAPDLWACLELRLKHGIGRASSQDLRLANLLQAAFAPTEQLGTAPTSNGALLS